MSFDWKAVVGTVAPGLAGLLAGPLAGVGVKALCSAFGMSADSTEEDLTARIQSMSSADLATIKKAELQLEADFATANVEMAKVEANDRADARQREKDTNDSVTMRTLAAFVLCMCSGVLFLILTGRVPQTVAPEMVGRIEGLCETLATLVLMYYFGGTVIKTVQKAASKLG